ncbi:hypothetical protein LPTSP4_09400 [Leptospira ryugenii]|uniref:Schlafen AlbA-2 domain-containing protein n=1 Tax=Leptospira ryugenii TaxID=1917863 RepID=A0A2P2DXS1_9LEPT|nr:RNA-binding domain-containing protein [Leptospira ryugenii]GBF49427.1 hypothetical protein LPTSP4_09400 [Leptospira ryugenii]
MSSLDLLFEDDEEKELFKLIEVGRGKKENVSSASKLLPAIKTIYAFKGKDFTFRILEDDNLSNLFSDRHCLFLPKYLVQFLKDLYAQEKYSNHLEPWFSPASMSILLDLGKTTAISNNKGEIEQLKKIITNHLLEIVNTDVIDFLNTTNTAFDLITSLSPLGVKTRNDNVIQSSDLSTQIIIKSCKLLSHDGTAVFLVTNSFFANKSRNEKLLNEDGIFIDAIFALSEKTFTSISIPTNLIIFRRKSIDKIFLTELTDNQDKNQVILTNYFERKNDLSNIFYIRPNSYSGIENHHIKLQIEKLETQYKVFSQFTFRDLILDLHLISSDRSIVENKNSIFIQRNQIIPFKAYEKLDHSLERWLQIILNEKVLSDYIYLFFQSDLGKLILKSVHKKNLTLTPLSIEELKEIPVAIPTLEEQKNIINIQEKLRNLKNTIEDFEQELALNPTTSYEVLTQLDSISEVLGTATDADKMYSLIRTGESKILEFKQTLSMDIVNLRKEVYIEDSAFKTIVAFLNTDGGKLLVGVTDSGSISGIDEEIRLLHKNSQDDFLLYYRNVLKNRIGEAFYPLIKEHIILCEKKKVLMIECSPSEEPCFLKSKDKNNNLDETFYARSPASSEKLTGKNLTEYVRNHKRFTR